MENSTSFLDGFHEILDKNQDPRSKDWPLMSSPFPTITITLIYIYVVKVLLPAYMKNRKPYDIQWLIVLHNFSQVLISVGLFFGFMFAGWFPVQYDVKCRQREGPIEGNGIKMMTICYCYFLAKFSEFFDTVLFVLRKKDSHASFLHMYHHGIMPLWCWSIFKYVPDSQITLFGLINSFVHIVMYTYYMLSAMGPKMQKYLWWKRHITLLQLVQFCIGAAYSSHMLINGCNIPTMLSVALLLESIFFFKMFFNFYTKAYDKKSVRTSKTEGIQTHQKVK